MNIKELIEKYELELKDVQLKFGANYKTKVYEGVLDDLKQLDEPQKVTVPQFVADWVNKAKGWGKTLYYALDHSPEEVNLWFCEDEANHQNNFARAWLDGYTVEKEKRYYVRFKGMESNDFNYLNFIKFQHAWVLSSIKLDKKFRTEHTKKQLEEAGFGWVFDCEGIELEEVQDDSKI